MLGRLKNRKNRKIFGSPKSVPQVPGNQGFERFFGPPTVSGFFSNFQPPQHKPHVELREPGSELRNPGFPFFTGGRDSEGTGVWSLGSEVAGFGFPIPRSIYTYSRSPAPAAVMLVSASSEMGMLKFFGSMTNDTA